MAEQLTFPLKLVIQTAGLHPFFFLPWEEFCLQRVRSLFAVWEVKSRWDLSEFCCQSYMNISRSIRLNFFKSWVVICSDFCIARGVPVNHVMWIQPFWSHLMWLLVCTFFFNLPLLDKFQELSISGKQSLANLYGVLKLPFFFFFLSDTLSCVSFLNL